MGQIATGTLVLETRLASWLAITEPAVSFLFPVVTLTVDGNVRPARYDCSSVVELQLPQTEGAGSIPVIPSN